MADDKQQQFEAAVNPDGDLPHPVDLRPGLPESTAEADSTKGANESIRDLLLAQSGRKADEPAEKPTAVKRTSKSDNK